MDAGLLSSSHASIDAVITWVDGGDSRHAEKLGNYLQSIGGTRPQSASATRFHNAGEIDYCVTSILKFAPWVRTIFIVTDNQIPDIVGKLIGTEFEGRVKVVDHKDIFAGYEEFLPTFNSSSILSMLWRIPGLAERFIFFNDDFFLIQPLKPEDFFRDGKVVLRGRWRLLPERMLHNILFGRWIKPFKKKKSFSFWAGQQITARKIGFTKKYFRLPHVPHAWRISTQQKYFSQHPDVLKENIKYRLRAYDQLIGESLAAHLELRNGKAIVDNELFNIQLKPVQQPLWRIRLKLWWADRNPKAVFTCIQSIEMASEKKRKLILNWLGRRVGKLEEKIMRNRYVFFVSAAYCYGIYRPIQELIWQRGEEVAWFFVDGVTPALTEKEHLLENEQTVKAYAPDVVFGAADWVPHYFPGLKVMLFHGMAINKRADANDVHYKIRDWYDLYCTHAEQDTKIFEKLAKQHQNFYVRKTGWPKLDSLIKQKSTSNNASSAVKTLFFASTFSPDITCAPFIADELKRISLEEGWHIIATLHPLMDSNTVNKFRSLAADNFTFLPPEADLYPAMLKADVMLCDTSSIMYEFMFLNKPVVTMNTRNPGPFLTNVTRVEDVFSAIQTVQTNAQQQLLAAQIECKKLNEFNDGNSSARVLDAIEEILSSKLLPSLKPKPLNLIRKLKLRKRLNYWKF